MSKETEQKAGNVLAFMVLAALVFLGFQYPSAAKWLLLGLCTTKIIGIIAKGEANG